MHRRTGDLFPVHLYMNPFLGLIAEGLHDFFQRSLAGFFISCPYEVTGLDVFNRYKPGFGCHQRPCYETLDLTKLLTNELHPSSHHTAGDTYFKRLLKRRSSAVCNLFSCSVGRCANRALNHTSQKRGCTRHSCRKCATDRSACSRYSDSLPVDLLATHCLRYNAGDCSANCTNYSTDGNMPEFAAVICTSHRIIIAVGVQIFIGQR